MGDDGVTIEFFRRKSLRQMHLMRSLTLFLKKVKDDAVLVLSEAWTPKEKRELIQTSMEEIDDDFRV